MVSKAVAADYRKQSVDVVVIGGGPGGSSCALRLAKLGKSVALIDDGTLSANEDKFGGTCLHVGCIPSKALLSLTEDYHKLQNGSIPGIPLLELEPDAEEISQHKQKKIDVLAKGYSNLLKKNGIKSIVGRATMLSSKQVKVVQEKAILEISAEHVVIATGSRPSTLKDIAKDGIRILDSTDFLQLRFLPETALVIGAGAIGLEAASIWTRLGVKVTIVEAIQRPFPHLDNDVYARVKKSLFSDFDEVILGKVVTSAQSDPDGVDVVIDNATGDSKPMQARFGALLVAVGRSPNTEGLMLENAGLDIEEKQFLQIDEYCHTDIVDLWAIGDVAVVKPDSLPSELQNFPVSPMLAHRATAEAMCVAGQIAGTPTSLDRMLIPSVVYTNPELAWVGFNEEMAKKIFPGDVKTTKANFAALGRAIASDKDDGVLKLIYRESTGKIIGCQILGYAAGELLQTVITGMEFGANIEDMADMVYSHPGYAELIQEASGAVLNKSIHS